MTTATKARQRTFYRSVLTIEILSDDPIPEDLSLEEIQEAITVGDCSGDTKWQALNEPKTGKEMAKLLQDQRSDPGFFLLNDDGTDSEDYEEGP